jgi:DNA replication protein DnaD
MAWIDLIFLANWKKSQFCVRGIMIDVPRGSLAYSQESLARRWRWTRFSVRHYLNYLEKSQQIKQQKSNITTLISIINYSKYQISEQQSELQSEQQTASRVTHQNKGNKVNKRAQPNFFKKYDEIPGAPPLATLQPDGTFKYIKP